MSAAAIDLIQFVEKSYDVHSTEVDWMSSLTSELVEIFEPTWMKGSVGYQVNFDQAGRIRLSSIVGSGEFPQEVIRLLEKFNELGERAVERAKWGAKVAYSVMAKGYRWGMLADMKVTLASQLPVPLSVVSFGLKDVSDVLIFRAPHIDRSGYSVAFLPFKDALSRNAANRSLILKLSAHAQSGFRLRRSLRLNAKVEETNALESSTVPELPKNGAIYDCLRDKLADADGEAAQKSSREILRAKVRAIDTARAKSSGRSEEALGVWHGLMDGTWTAVDRHDHDGRRYMVIHRNAEQLKDPRGLTDVEARVCAYAARGLSNKAIAYQVGLSEGAIASHLSSSFAKLSIKKRAKLRKALGI